jgi:site-specific DNA-methyltransferase (adenine-specific)
LEGLADLPKNSVDAIITDPPYGLSKNNTTQGTSQRVYDALFKIGFPDLYKRNAELLKSHDFANIASSSSILCRKARTSRIESRIGMPKGSIDFQHKMIIEEEICNSDETSGLWAADRILSDEIYANAEQFLGDFVLKLGDMPSFGVVGDIPDSCLAEVFYGGFAVPIFASFASGSPCFDSRGMMITFGHHDIRLGNDSFCQSETASCILTVPGTVNSLMLRFDSTGRPVELLATNRADHLATLGKFDGPKLVRATSTTSSLASVAQLVRVRFVVCTTDGARSLYWFHLWLPFNSKNVKIIPNGGFMGKCWDSALPDPQIWRELLRVAKPGAMLMAFGGTRTHHRLLCAIEDAGWEIRDCLMWLYGMGFPKSFDISKGMDKEAGAEREVVGRKYVGSGNKRKPSHDYGRYDGPEDLGGLNVTIPSTPDAQLWEGYGTALKPAWEPIVLAMKPLDGTFAQNAIKWGVAGLNIDGSRIGTDKVGWGGNAGFKHTHEASKQAGLGLPDPNPAIGRFPANLVLSHTPECRQVGTKRVKTRWNGTDNAPQSEAGVVFGGGKGNRSRTDPDGMETVEAWECTPDCPVRLLNEQSGVSNGWRPSDTCDSTTTIWGNAGGASKTRHKDTGGASRFFYTAKASRSERNQGCDDFYWQRVGSTSCGYVRISYREWEKLPEKERAQGNIHTTVKPLSLMEYLCKLARTPFGGVVLDPFAGSCSTGCAALDNDMQFIGMDNVPDYIDISQARIRYHQLNRCPVGKAAQNLEGR